jgi:beta-glucosidase
LLSARRWVPLIKKGLTLPESKEPGLLLEWFSEDPSLDKGAKILQSETTTSTQMYFSQMFFPLVPTAHYIRVRTTFAAPQTGKYRFALSVCGKARLLVDGNEMVDQWNSQPEKNDDTACFNKLCAERHADIDVEQGRAYELEIIMTNILLNAHSGAPAPGGLRLGGRLLCDDDEAISAAVTLAQSVDVPIIMTGLSAEYESEAADRKNLFLPCRLNELIQRVTEANSKTVSDLNRLLLLQVLSSLVKIEN